MQSDPGTNSCKEMIVEGSESMINYATNGLHGSVTLEKGNTKTVKIITRLTTGKIRLQYWLGENITVLKEQ